MKLAVVRVERSSAKWADAAAHDYGRRLRRWGGCEETVVRAEAFRGDVDAVRAAEGARLRRLVKPRDRWVVLDERGEDVDGAAMLALIRDARREVGGSLVFALGGPYGHDPVFRAEADRVIRLSPMVLNHQVARVVLMEQLYRAMAALHGTPYGH